MPVHTITPMDLKPRLDRGEPIDLIDVRTPLEFSEVHAAPARLVPLDQLDPSEVVAARSARGEEPIYFICRSGARGAKASEKLIASGFTNVLDVEGGTQAWIEAGLPVVRGTRKVISLERQVRIAAGAIVLIGVVLGYLVHPGFFAISGFIGAGLIFAGVTDFCGMGMLIARMPWNRRSST